MNLIQLSEAQLQRLIQFGIKPSDFVFIEGSIPPKHVLNRSMNLFHNAVGVIWSLPYFIQKNTQIIGCCGFKGTPCNKRVEIGYHVASDMRGMGIATSAIKLLSRIAFYSGEVDAVVALISSDNKASLNVVQKNGFTYTEVVVNEDGEELESWILNRYASKLDLNT